MNIAKTQPRWDLRNDKAMAQAVRYARIPLCITDPTLPDNPIVFANAAFLDLTGYAEADVLGVNCRLLQGDATTQDSVDAVRRVIAQQRVDTVEIINYRKDGSTFVNALQIGPILDDNGNLMYYFGSQLDVTARRDAERQARKLADEELLHRLRNVSNVMAAIIRMSSREEDDAQVLATKVSERLAALSEAHFQTISRPDDQGQDFRTLAGTILQAYAPKGPQVAALSGPDVIVPPHLISCLALILHELATNSVKHGALSAEAGRITLDWQMQSDPDGKTLALKWQERDGPKVVMPQRHSGSRIVHNLIAAQGRSIELDWQETGLIADMVLPL